MPWREFSVVGERAEFCRLVEVGGVSLAELCRRFGISRPTGYLWLERYRSEGVEGLVDRSHRPVSSPDRFGVEIEELVCQLRREHPRWGGRKIWKVLTRRGYSPVPAPSTVTGILRRNGLLSPTPQPRGYVSFEYEEPNQLWQMDFKGWFSLTDGNRCHPFGLLGDHSRYNLALAACSDQRTGTVQTLLESTFRRYGLPERILCDNGSPWGNAFGQPWTPLGVWLLDVGVGVVHSRPYHPQTAGKEERFHLTLDWEVLETRPVWDSYLQVQTAFDRWRPVYNHERPHDSLGLEVPADRYQPSPRPYPEQIPPIDYPPGYQIRKHSRDGISFQGNRIRLPKVFHGRSLGIYPTPTDGQYQIWYRNHIIRTIDLTTP